MWRIRAHRACTGPTNVLPGRADGPVRLAPPKIYHHPGQQSRNGLCPREPHGEASDIDLPEMAAQVIQRKSITVRWIPGHHQLFDASIAQHRIDILRNIEVDRLAKLATTLPFQLYTPTFPSSISLGGTEAPTPAKKWITALRPYPHPSRGSLGHVATCYHGYLCGHAAAKCGSNGFGATSTGKGVPPPPPPLGEDKGQL